jgi:carboxypeptidase D
MALPLSMLRLPCLQVLLLFSLTLSGCTTTTALRIFPKWHGHHDASLESLEQSWRRRLTTNTKSKINTKINTNKGPKPPVEVPKAKTPDDHLVTELPLLDASKFPTDHWAGLLPSSPDGDNYLFYWLFAPDLTDHPDLQAQAQAQAQDDDKDIPLIIWLNGGPGCSSMDGVWLETGPFRLTQTTAPDGDDAADADHAADTDHAAAWTIDISEHSWHKAPAYVLFVDQPVGTGLSFTTSGKYATNDDQINTDFYYFFNQFLNLHSQTFLLIAQGDGDGDDGDDGDVEKEKRKIFRRPLYFSGESYAGHYIPLMMSYIREKNLNETNIDIRLSGAAIGNGWIDPYHQFSIHQAAYGHGIVDQEQVNALDEMERACLKDYVRGEETPAVCWDLFDTVIDNSAGDDDDAPYHVSPYDVRVWDKDGETTEYPDGYKIVESYLGGHSVPHGKPEIGVSYANVLDAIHASPSKKAGQRYTECNSAPSCALPDSDDGVTQEIVELLHAGLNLLFYNGVYDLVCNHVGNEKALDHLEWEHQSEFMLAKGYAWASSSASSDGNNIAIPVPIAGYIKQYENLLFLKVLNSGHMVPWDQPLASFDMIKTFLYKKDSFKTYEQNITPKAAPPEESSYDCPICPTTTTTTTSVGQPPPPPPPPNDNDNTCLACVECNDNQANAEQDGATSPSEIVKLPDDNKSTTTIRQAYYWMVGFLILGLLFVGFGCALYYYYYYFATKINRRSQVPLVNEIESSSSSSSLGLEMQTARNGSRDDDDDDVSDEGRDF